MRESARSLPNTEQRYGRGGYRTDILYCGNDNYGYRHLKPHIGQYFGGWGGFTYSVGAVLLKPQKTTPQKNGNYRKYGPIYQCFYAGYYVVWRFYVIVGIRSGSIVTAYGHKERTVDESCP